MEKSVTEKMHKAITDQIQHTDRILRELGPLDDTNGPRWHTRQGVLIGLTTALSICEFHSGWIETKENEPVVGGYREPWNK